MVLKAKLPSESENSFSVNVKTNEISQMKFTRGLLPLSFASLLVYVVCAFVPVFLFYTFLSEFKGVEEDLVHVPVPKNINRPASIQNIKSQPSLRAPYYYQNGMVFQAGPRQHNVWGFTNDTSVPIHIKETWNERSQTSTVSKFTPLNEGDGSIYIWETLMPPFGSNGDRCLLHVTQGSAKFNFSIVFGDVWFCSGQSNMGLEIYRIKTQDKVDLRELETGGYENINFYNMQKETSSKVKIDRIPSKKTFHNQWIQLGDTKHTAWVKQMSAVCLLFAKELTDAFKRRKETPPTLGLVHSSYPGSSIESWLPQTVLNSCDIKPYTEKTLFHCNSYVGNIMLQPFLRHSIMGVLWYQGENNAKHNTDKYTCSLKALLKYWRSSFANGGEDFVFGSVQIGNVEKGKNIIPWSLREMKTINYAPMRWHQTLDHGFLPNSDFPNSFLATAIDTYDNGDIHPRYKTIVAKRLSDAAMEQVYYSKKPQPVISPFPKSTSLNDNKLRMQLNQGVTYNPQDGNKSGFYACCHPNVQHCDSDEKESLWTSIPKSNVQFDATESAFELNTDSMSKKCQSPSGFAYAWETNPFRTYLGAAIYSQNEYKLPALPWRCAVEKEQNCVIK